VGEGRAFKKFLGLNLHVDESFFYGELKIEIVSSIFA
jgi:hypothetical protein